MCFCYYDYYFDNCYCIHISRVHTFIMLFISIFLICCRYSVFQSLECCCLFSILCTFKSNYKTHTQSFWLCTALFDVWLHLYIWFSFVFRPRSWSSIRIWVALLFVFFHLSHKSDSIEYWICKYKIQAHDFIPLHCDFEWFEYTISHRTNCSDNRSEQKKKKTTQKQRHEEKWRNEFKWKLIEMKWTITQMLRECS